MESQLLRNVLCRARAVIADELRFTGDGYAADASGRWCPVDRPDAARFSVWGAMLRASGASKVVMTSARTLFADAAPELSQRLHRGPLTHAESLALLDAAIGALGCASASVGDVRAAPPVSAARELLS